MYVVHSSLPWTEEQRASILAHLDKLLESPAFNGSPRRQAFLRYVVEQTLAGSGTSIKERNIAVDVFERSDDFDAQSASIVRVTGSEVRKRLAQTYAAGFDQSVRIELPLGSYQPVFHFDPQAHPAAVPAPEVRGKEPVRVRRRHSAPLLFAGAGAALVAGIFLLPGMVHGTSATDQVWQPLLNRDQPVLISLATINTPAPKSGGEGTAFVGTGGALGAARFAEQLALHHQSFTLKFGNDASFSDLKRSAAILIGGTRWSDELMRTLRFRVERGDQGRAVIDSQAPERRWSDPGPGTAATSGEGYSIVTRLLRSESGHPVILIVGLDPRDTQAGVEFLADERLFEKFSATAPGDWTRRNFQIVLHDRIFGNSPGSMNVVASHVW
jgi:hypothetical protein